MLCSFPFQRRPSIILLANATARAFTSSPIASGFVQPPTNQWPAIRPLSHSTNCWKPGNDQVRVIRLLATPGKQKGHPLAM